MQPPSLPYMLPGESESAPVGGGAPVAVTIPQDCPPSTTFAVSVPYHGMFAVTTPSYALPGQTIIMRLPASAPAVAPPRGPPQAQAILQQSQAGALQLLQHAPSVVRGDDSASHAGSSRDSESRRERRRRRSPRPDRVTRGRGDSLPDLASPQHAAQPQDVTNPLTLAFNDDNGLDAEWRHEQFSRLFAAHMVGAAAIVVSEVLLDEGVTRIIAVTGVIFGSALRVYYYLMPRVPAPLNGYKYSQIVIMSSLAPCIMWRSSKPSADIANVSIELYGMRA